MFERISMSSPPKLLSHADDPDMDVLVIIVQSLSEWPTDQFPPGDLSVPRAFFCTARSR